MSALEKAAIISLIGNIASMVLMRLWSSWEHKKTERKLNDLHSRLDNGK